MPDLWLEVRLSLDEAVPSHLLENPLDTLIPASLSKVWVLAVGNFMIPIPEEFHFSYRILSSRTSRYTRLSGNILSEQLILRTVEIS